MLSVLDNKKGTDIGYIVYVVDYRYILTLFVLILIHGYNIFAQSILEPSYPKHVPIVFQSGR